MNENNFQISNELDVLFKNKCRDFISKLPITCEHVCDLIAIDVYIHLYFSFFIFKLLAS